MAKKDDIIPRAPDDPARVEADWADEVARRDEELRSGRGVGTRYEVSSDV